MSLPLEEIPTDGRRARRHRSRDLAVDALLDLLQEGVIRPTAQQVAERSGVSLRSIFRIFDDVETLHAAANTRQLARVRHLFVDVPDVGSVADRVTAIVAIDARLYEAVAPIRRAALRVAAESGPATDQLGRARAWLRGEIDRVFAPELDGPKGAVRAAALELLFSFEGWDQLRSSQGLSIDDASSVIRASALSILEAATS